jgi:hypothetical protein
VKIVPITLNNDAGVTMLANVEADQEVDPIWACGELRGKEHLRRFPRERVCRRRQWRAAIEAVDHRESLSEGPFNRAFTDFPHGAALDDVSNALVYLIDKRPENYVGPLGRFSH